MFEAVRSSAAAPTPRSPSASDVAPAGTPKLRARRLRLAYLTTEYPKVSHTFIRREILELERTGQPVLRVAIRGGGQAVADAADRAEAEKTLVCLRHSFARFALAVALALVTRPARFLRALSAAVSMGKGSDRGLLRNLAYLVEACLLLRILAAREVEHVHVHFGTNAAAVARLIRRLGGPTYSMTVHGPDEFDAPRGISLGAKVADATFVAAISSYCAAQIRRWAPYDSWSKIHIVRCTVGEEFFEKVQPIDRASNTLLSIGRLSAQKGQHLLIDGMIRLRDQGVEAKLVLAGDGEMREVIERRIADADLGGHVEITGWVDEATVRRLLSECRALVQPSFAEGLPVVIMEALAMGRPVITTTIAGIPELMRNGENGWLVTSGDVEELSTAMRRAVETSTEELAGMGRAGQQRVKERHRTRVEVGKLALLFERYGVSNGASNGAPKDDT